jgi:surface-anchored protein
MRRSFFQIAFVCLGLTGNAFAQHIHIQTSFTPTAGWNIFWYDFDAGAFPAGDFTQPVTKAARGQIPNALTLINALGAAGNPVWVLPQVETSELPSLGLGTQGSGSFVGGQISLRLVSFTGPGHLAIYTLDAFGDAQVLVATNDGLSSADAIPQSFPAGHIHVNWAFTRPGLYQLGWQAEGTLTGGTVTNSSVVTFQFQVVPPLPPVLALTLTNGWQRLRVQTEGNVPLTVESSTNLVSWSAFTNVWSSASDWELVAPALPGPVFYRASHNFPMN